MKSLPKISSIKMLLFLLLALGPLRAESSFYSSEEPRGELFSIFLDKLADAGIKLTTRTFFNEKNDGKLGFSFWLYPGKTHGEITFHNRSQGKGSIVKVMTQNSDDMTRLREFFIKQMKMKEEPGLSGVVPKNAPEGF